MLILLATPSLRIYPTGVPHIQFTQIRVQRYLLLIDGGTGTVKCKAVIREKEVHLWVRM